MEQPLVTYNQLEIAARRVLSNLPSYIRYSLNGRLERGLYLAARGAVMPYIDQRRPWHTRLFLVLSSNQYTPPYSYCVDLNALSCECPDNHKGHHCKHILAVQIVEQAKLEIA